MKERIPHFTTFGKNYMRRFAGSDVFERIFERILSEAVEAGFVDAKAVFMDAMHLKANENNHKYRKETVQKEAKHYQKELMEEIYEDREAHQKKAFDDDDDKPNPPAVKKIKSSTTYPNFFMGFGLPKNRLCIV